MSLETTPYVISALQHSAQLFRQTLQDLISGTGVVGSTDLEVTPGTGLAVKIGAGKIFIPGTQGSTTGQRENLGSQHATYTSLPADFTSQGVYDAVAAAASELSLSAANETNPRIDLVCASIQDTQYSGSFNRALLQIVTGTPAGSPKPGTPPESTVVLAEVEVPAKATQVKTEHITSQRPVVGAGAVTTAKLANEAVTDAKVVAGRALVDTENAYGAQTERLYNTLYTPSTTRMTFVTLEGLGVTGGGSIEVKVGGVKIGKVPLAAEGDRASFSFLCSPNVAYELIKSGEVAPYTSYLTL